MSPPNADTPPPEAPNAPPMRPPSRRRRWVGALVAVLVLGGLVGGSYYLIKRPAEEGRGGPGGGPRGPGGPGGGFGVVTVGHATVAQADIPITLDALGTVTPLATITLKPQVGGVLTDVLFTEGQTVRKGQLLARIDPRTYEQALEQARGTRMRDEAQLEAARVTLTRYRTLLGQDSIARQDVDTQAALVKQLEGTVVSDKASESAARVNLDFTRITAPVTGRIGLRTVDPGNTVAAGSSTGIAVITQMNPIDVQFSVPQDRVPEIQTEVAAGKTLTVAAMDRTRSDRLDTGTFSTLDNVVDTTTGTVKAKARFDNVQAKLFPNQFVNIRLTLRTVSALVVPVTAVRTGPNGPYVYVIGEDRTVSMRAVKRGESTVDVTAITDGLKLGELVVTEGGDRLSEGSRVQLQGERPAVAPRQGGGGGRRRGQAGAGAGAPAAGAGGAVAPGPGAPPAPQGTGAAPPAVVGTPGPAPVGEGTPATAAPAGASVTPPNGGSPRGGASNDNGAGRSDGEAPAPSTAAAPALPTAEQRQRMLDAAKDEPEQLARRKHFLEQLDKGDPEALERWRRMQQHRREGGGARGSGGAGG